jgi:hypothetical protein
MESPVKEEVAGELAMEIESSVTAEDWRRALSRVVPAVAVLRTTAPRAFDTEVAGASYATGFVVDKARGIILTNRHVVKPGNRPHLSDVFPLAVAGLSIPYALRMTDSCAAVLAGPVVAEAMFVNREEIPVYPLYRDPVSVCSVRFHYALFYFALP